MHSTPVPIPFLARSLLSRNRTSIGDRRRYDEQIRAGLSLDEPGDWLWKRRQVATPRRVCQRRFVLNPNRLLIKYAECGPPRTGEYAWWQLSAQTWQSKSGSSAIPNPAQRARRQVRRCGGCPAKIDAVRRPNSAGPSGNCPVASGLPREQSARGWIGDAPLSSVAEFSSIGPRHCAVAARRSAWAPPN